MRKIIPIDRFFAEMALSEAEKKRREDLATDLYLLFLLFFSEVEAEKVIQNTSKPVIDVEYYKDMLTRRVCDDFETLYVVLVAALLGRKTMTDELKENVKQRISDIVDTTMKFEDEFYTSDDRATMLGCNEANYLGNDTDYHIAEYQGYRHKQWLTMKDERVRPTHALVDGQTIGIDEYFHVGQAVLLYPMDMSGNGAEHPEETALCRCVVEYLR